MHTLEPVTKQASENVMPEIEKGDILIKIRRYKNEAKFTMWYDSFERGYPDADSFFDDLKKFIVERVKECM